jgi:cyanophycinase-like exopeptidase
MPEMGEIVMAHPDNRSPLRSVKSASRRISTIVMPHLSGDIRMRPPFSLSDRLFRIVAGFLITIATATGHIEAWAAKKYEYYFVGNPADVSRPMPSQSSFVLMGGGPDVDVAFQWMIEKSGGGNFVVIRAAGTDAYNPYIFALGGNGTGSLKSVETLVIPSVDAANDEFVLERVRGAEALFIAGGDQSDYIKLWQNTRLQKEIQGLVDRKVPVGGTSAGLMVLSQFIFTALNGSVTSTTALSNPYDKDITLGRDFLAINPLAGCIADAHLDSRDRMGRLITFMARLIADGQAVGGTVRGIGVTVETALLIENGIGRKVGVPEGSIYFLRSVARPEVIAPKTPLTFRNVDVRRLSGAGTFDLQNWASYDGGVTTYSISAIKGILYSTQPNGAIY